MKVIVQKFGGSSVSNDENLKIVSKRVVEEVENKNKVVVVVSAQGKTTDRLIFEEKQLSQNASLREHDTLVSVGEQITIAKLAILLNEMGYKAISLTGWQIPIITNNDHSNARIEYINNEIINKYLDDGNIVVVAGFQGVNENGEITTLGRGGSDTTAVAIAASLEADRCDIFTDVDGVFVSDPKYVVNSKKIDKIDYEEMLEMSSLGAKVLHNRCVEIGKNFSIPICVKSTFKDNSKGTLVTNKKIEDNNINGIVKDDKISKISLVGVDNTTKSIYELVKILSRENICIDFLNKREETKTISFTIKDADLDRVLKIIEVNISKLAYKEIIHNEDLAKVSIVGIGIYNKPEIQEKMLEALYEKNLNFVDISTSETKITLLLDKNISDIALNEIYNKFF